MPSKVAVTEGSGKNIATNSFIEDAVTKEAQRIVLNNSSGTEIGTSANPVVINQGSTIGVYFDRANPSVSIGGQSATLNVAFDPGHTLGSISNIQQSVAVYFDRSAPAVSIPSSIAVYFDRGNPAVSVNYGSGTFLVAFDRANPSVNIGTPTVFTNAGATASIFTVTGSTSTAGNNTLVSPSANYSFKVFAYSITTTAQVGIVPRFTTGASAGATELWRIALQAPTQGISGANLAVPPPAYLFATGTSNTLSLYIDSASLVHYSLSYIKESS